MIAHQPRHRHRNYSEKNQNITETGHGSVEKNDTSHQSELFLVVHRASELEFEPFNDPEA